MIKLPIVSTHSMLKEFKRCPRMAMYHYVDCIQPREVSRPLRMGIWFHSLLEAHYKGEDWRERHQELIDEHHEKFFDQEIGDVPDACYRSMRSYLWYYQLEKKYGWKVKEVELKLETTWPDGHPYWCKLDLLVEIDGELWIVDHKKRSKLPDHFQRLLDSQNLMYIWAAHKNGIKVAGFIWNYVAMKAPTIPQVRKDGKLSERKILTDFLTLKEAIEDNHLDPREYASQLRELKEVYWRPGRPQTSEFFQRQSLDRDPAAVKRLVLEMHHTHKRMREYPFDNRVAVERIVDESCKWHCSYPLICTSELYDGNTEELMRLHYRKVDPFGYYTGA